jgi:uncharacterized membrane protein
MTEAARDPVLFDATLRPHRSLGRRGFLLVMAAVAGGGFLIGTGFFLAGAWPVAGFCGLEILLVYIAFKMNFREGRRAEHLRLTPDGLDVTHIAPNGKQGTLRFEPTGLSVQMDDPPRHDSRLTLRSRGKQLEIGAFLQPFEKLEVAEALRAALIRYRETPAF